MPDWRDHEGEEPLAPFEGMVKKSDELSDQTRLSILNWNPAPNRGNIGNSVMRSLHVILLQEAESHFMRLSQLRGHFRPQKHFRARWCEDRGRGTGHINARLFWLEKLVGQVKVQEAS